MKRSHRALVIAAAVAAICIFAFGLWLGRTVPELPPLSGERASRAVAATDFDRVEVRGQWQVEIARGAGWEVELSYPIELAADLSVGVENRELTLRLPPRRGGWSDFGRNERLRLTARIVMPELRGLETAGASLVTFAGFDGGELEIEASGASRIEGRDSRYDELDIEMSGAGAADLSGVTVEDARVDVSGALTVTLRIDGGDLAGDLSGASTVEYYGTVRELRIDTSGVARVRALE